MKTLSISFRALGTVNSIEMPALSGQADYPEEGMELLRDIRERMQDVNSRWSAFLGDSEISELNAAAGNRAVEVQEDTIRILKDSVKYAELTNGIFDITTRPLSILWSIGKRGTYIPSEDEIKRVLPLIDYRDIVLKKDSAFLKRKGQAVDLGGIAKGWAVDTAADFLNQHQVKEYTINFGGTVAVRGGERKIGIRNPFAGLLASDRTAGYLTVKDECVVTSGTYERYFMKDGIRYHHILDPRTGQPAHTNLASVTLIGENAEELDALCTTVILYGMKDGTKLVKERGLKGLFISEDGKTFTTGHDVKYNL